MQTILITGASQGIGREIALQLAAQGHTVVAWARTQALLDTLQRDGGGRVKTQRVDLAVTSSLPAAVEQLLNTFPTLNGVIHSAAIQVERPLIDTTIAQIEQEIAINLTAPVVLTQLLLAHLREQPQAFVCTISSALALAAKRSSAVYCATKAGLHIFSDSLRSQLAHTKIDVIEVLPPTVETRMTAHRQVPKMGADKVARLTIAAITKRKKTTLLGKAKLLGVLLRVAPSVAKRIMLKF